MEVKVEKRDIKGYLENLKEQIQFSNELKEKTHTNVWSVEVEIALNEIDWKNPNLDLESRATISDEILEKYSNKYKYGVNIKEMKYYGYFFNKNNTLQILKNLKYNLSYTCGNKTLLEAVA